MMTVQTFPMNTLRFDPEACTGCGMCLEVCPHGVFELQGDIVAALHGADCMECGACQLNCPTDAIQVDSGVGCAGAMIRAALLGQKEATCG